MKNENLTIEFERGLEVDDGFEITKQWCWTVFDRGRYQLHVSDGFKTLEDAVEDLRLNGLEIVNNLDQYY
jgi:hypothetical protein